MMRCMLRPGNSTVKPDKSNKMDVAVFKPVLRKFMQEPADGEDPA